MVLRSMKRPLSARAILKHAYANDIAPHHLYGKTQHKTLQARLSEDILHRREQSLFFRTKPGHFFLREFITDTSIPAEFRQPIIARRRTRDLFLEPALTLNYDVAKHFIPKGTFSKPETVDKIAKSGLYHYADPKHRNSDDVLLWAVSALTRQNKILSYRIGRYRDDRDHFAHKRSIAFSTLVSQTNHTLFDAGNLGISDSALFAVATDLDIPLPEALATHSVFEHLMRFVTWQPDQINETGLLAFVEVSAPDWFEPIADKLSLNDLSWIDISTPPNNWEDFDPCSQTILSYYFPKVAIYG